MGDINDKSRKENLQLFGMAVELGKEGLQQEQFERELGLRETNARLDRITQKEIAALKPSNPSDFEIMMGIMQNGTPEQKAVLKEVIALKQPQTGGLVLPPDPTGGAGVDLSKWGQPTVVPQ
jgi:hypothetical protein